MKTSVLAVIATALLWGALQQAAVAAPLAVAPPAAAARSGLVEARWVTRCHWHHRHHHHHGYRVCRRVHIL
jgi:hypothetical protein